MIKCYFENGNQAGLRHVVTHAICKKDNKLLLVRRSLNLLEGGKLALPGGFLDRDEDIYQGVLRELLEETGWQGEVIHLLKINSKPNRPFEDRQNVAFDFIVKAIKQVADPDSESSDVCWWDIDQLDLSSLAFDHGQSIELFLKFCQSPFSIPVVV